MKRFALKQIAKIMSLVFILSCAFCINASAVTYTTKDGLWTYSYKSGEATLVKYNGNSSIVTTPENVDNYPVVAIEGTFYDNDSIRQIIISSGVTEIKCSNDAYTHGAFENCENLTKVILPNSVNTIGESAFHSCTALTDIELNEGLYTIDKEAFYYCTKLKSILIPSTVTSIGMNVFDSSAIENIVIPAHVNAVSSRAFYHCEQLSSVTIEEGVKVINSKAFEGCSKLTKIIIPRSVTTISNYDTFFGANNLIIYGYENSTAENFADENGFIFRFVKPISLSSNSIRMNYKSTSSIYVINSVNYEVKYTSSNEDVIIVDQYGNIKSVGIGTATITATVDGTTDFDTCTVKVSYAWWQQIIRFLLLGFIWY